MFGIFWAVTLVVLPIFHSKIIVDFRHQRNVLFLFIGLISIALFKKRQSIILSIASVLLFIKTFISKYILASSYVLMGGMISIKNYGDITGKSFFQTVNIFIGITLIGQFAENWDKECKRWLSEALSLSAIVQSLWIIAQRYGYEPLKYLYGFDNIRGIGAVTGSLDNSMVTGCLMAALFPFLLRKWWFIGIPLFAWALFTLNSAMGVFGVFIVSVYLTIKNFSPRIKLLLISLSGIIGTLLLVLFNRFFNDGGRYKSWKEILNNTGISITGNGFGFYNDHGWQSVKGVEKLAHPHNEYISLYVASGFIGTLFAVCTIAYLLQWHKKDSLFTASLLSIFATSFGAFPLHIGPSSIMLIIGIGVLLHHFQKSEQCRKLLSLLKLSGFLLLYAHGLCLETIKKWMQSMKHKSESFSR